MRDEYGSEAVRAIPGSAHPDRPLLTRAFSFRGGHLPTMPEHPVAACVTTTVSPSPGLESGSPVLLVDHLCGDDLGQIMVERAVADQAPDDPGAKLVWAEAGGCVVAQRLGVCIGR